MLQKLKMFFPAGYNTQYTGKAHTIILLCNHISYDLGLMNSKSQLAILSSKITSQENYGLHSPQTIEPSYYG